MLRVFEFGFKNLVRNSVVYNSHQRMDIIAENDYI